MDKHIKVDLIGVQRFIKNEVERGIAMLIEIQKLLFPKPQYCMEESLYFRRLNDKTCLLDCELGQLDMEKNALCSFDTYFNGFSIGKWRKYTLLKDLWLRLRYKGKITVSLVNITLVNGIIINKVIQEKELESENPICAEFSFTGFEQSGMHSFIVRARSNASIYSGAYYAEVADDTTLSDVRIALNMCTFHKEQYIYRNVERILTELVNDPESPLHDKLWLYITDNAMSLDEQRLNDPHITLTKQNAFGSVGGFTRGLMNVHRDKYSKELTHVLFLDDDIVIDPQVLCRTYWFWRLIRPQFKNAWLGGGMLGLDFPSVQTESAGLIENGEYRSLKANINMSELWNVLFNEIEENAHINAWWYCGMPLSSLDEDGLPYPVYFHCDDMEYAMRCCQKLITLNGICVWHEEFFYKSDTHYYDRRNREILYSLHIPESATLHKAKKRLIVNVGQNLLWYRYHDAEEILDGVRDFLRGPQWLVNADDRAKFEEVRKARVPMTPVFELPFTFNYQRYVESLTYKNEKTGRRFWRRLTLNGWLLPANGNAIVRAEKPLTYCFYRVKTALNYSTKTNCGYLTHKSYRKAFHILKKLVGVLIDMNRKYNKVRNSYRDTIKDYTTWQFWEQNFQTEERG